LSPVQYRFVGTSGEAFIHGVTIVIKSKLN